MIARAKERLRFQGVEHQDGTEAAERALALDDNHSGAHAARAMVYQRLTRYDDAEREIERALALGPDTFEANIGRAALHFVQGRMRESVPYYERAADLSPTDCGGVFMLGTVYRALGDDEAARNSAQRVVERAERIVAREPDNCVTISWLVGGLGVLGEVDRARELIDRALILDPDDFNMRYNFACILVRELADPDAALELLETSFKLAHVPALNWMKIDPDLDRLRDHPRFKAMMAEADARIAASA